jgi:hypothetical protein
MLPKHRVKYKGDKKRKEGKATIVAYSKALSRIRLENEGSYFENLARIIV